MLQPGQSGRRRTPDETGGIQPGTPVYLSKSEAIAAVAESESTVKKYLREGRLSNAIKDEAGLWRIPASDLTGAGLTLLAPGGDQGDKGGNQPAAQPPDEPVMTLPMSVVVELRVQASQADSLRRELATQARALEMAAGALRALEAAPNRQPDPTMDVRATEPEPAAAQTIDLRDLSWRAKRRRKKEARLRAH